MSRLRFPWRAPAGVALPAIVFIGLLVIVWPRDQILTFAARTEVLSFTATDDVTTKFWIARGRWGAGPGSVDRAIADQLVSLAAGSVVTARAAGDAIVLTVSHATSAGTLGRDTLSGRAWIHVNGPEDENLIIPFVGPFSIGEQVGPTTAAVLLDGRAEVVERVLFGSLTYVNRTIELIRGDQLDVDEPGQTARGFIHFRWGRDGESGMFVRAQADAGSARLFRTPERPALTLRGSLWGRLREGADVGYLLLALTGLSAIVQILLYFRSEPARTDPGPRSPAAPAFTPGETAQESAEEPVQAADDAVRRGPPE
jgi:hypothetical protein